MSFVWTDGSRKAGTGILEDGHVRVLQHCDHDMAVTLEALADGRLHDSPTIAQHPLESLSLGPPVARPSKIVCVGLNYLDHAVESAMDPPEVPLLFAKFPNSLVGAGAAIAKPAGTEQLDYEAELAVVIGRTVRDIDANTALDAVAGYMNFNDVSARDIQLHEGGQWTRGKSLDSFAPCGPYLLTADEVSDPQRLEVQCRLNGEVVQQSNTEHMLFGVAELVAFISQDLTLVPGDIIATGTPPGVGAARRPPVYLQEGDEVTVSVTGLGDLSNPVTGPSGASTS